MISNTARLVFAAILLFSILAWVMNDQVDAGQWPVQPTRWELQLPKKICPNLGHYECYRGSPKAVDFDGDGRSEIVVVTHNGHILLIRETGGVGSIVWDVDTAPYFGMSANSQEIHSSPAVGDIDGDGLMEIVVGVGALYPGNGCVPGGIIVLEDDGKVKAPWPFIMADFPIEDGCAEGVFSSPALGDLDKDGDLEIVVGGLDQRIYALHHNKTAVAGFPINSNHRQRFDWSRLNGKLTDQVWSSPALGDVTGDGYLDIIIGTNEGNFSNIYTPAGNGWTCPYAEPMLVGYCGGSLYGLDRFGRAIGGFPRYFYESVMSSPALYDINQDGVKEIFVGMGIYNFEYSVDHPLYGARLYGMDGRGKDLPGWAGGKDLVTPTAVSPVIGDIVGDSGVEIVIGTRGGMLYAFHDTGGLVAGFPMQPKDQYNAPLSIHIGKSAALVDYTKNGKMEILINQNWVVNIIDGTGKQLTTSNFPSGDLMYYAQGLMLNNPAVADLDGDGTLELIAHNQRLSVWSLPNVTNAAWPMFKYDAVGSSTPNQPWVLLEGQYIPVWIWR